MCIYKMVFKAIKTDNNFKQKKMTTSDQQQLKEALRYAHFLLEDQASKGFYPEAALVENGGKGFAPITKALEKIEKANTDISFLTDSLTKDFDNNISTVLIDGLRYRGFEIKSQTDLIEFVTKNKFTVTETGNKQFYHINGSLFCEITLGRIQYDHLKRSLTISRDFSYKYYNE